MYNVLNVRLLPPLLPPPLVCVLPCLPPPVPHCLLPPSCCSFEDYKLTTEWLLNQTSHRPKIAVICGWGLGLLADGVSNKQIFRYQDVPNFPVSTGQLQHRPLLAVLHVYLLFNVVNIQTELQTLCDICSLPTFLPYSSAFLNITNI